MGRKKKPGGHENSERWMVSYADLLTLMFALFVVLFASSQEDKGKAQQISESVKRALDGGQMTAVIAGIMGGGGDLKSKGGASVAMKPPKGKGAPAAGGHPAIAELLPSLEYLTRELKKEIESGKLQLRMESRGLVVSLTEAAFFHSGEAGILPATHESLDKIAGVIAKLPNPVRLEGHTDSVPIHNSRFRSNWELSSARSIAMLELLTTRCRIPISRLAVAGYADNVPVAPNGTEEGRARNRRVDIVMLNKAGYEIEPSSPVPKDEVMPTTQRSH
ncbi:MAG TPA: flagellar motor protein MotB [Bryobacteraceae bacterium]|nr:flagellar motor protein MotB [Bryobacteraceae bacterium]